MPYLGEMEHLPNTQGRETLQAPGGRLDLRGSLLLADPSQQGRSAPLSFMTFFPRPEPEIQVPGHSDLTQCLCSQLHPFEKRSLGKSFSPLLSDATETLA